MTLSVINGDETKFPIIQITLILILTTLTFSQFELKYGYFSNTESLFRKIEKDLF